MGGHPWTIRLLAAILLLWASAWASVSLMTGAVLVGADRLSSLDAEARALDRVLRDLETSTGYLCLLREHHRYGDGLSYGRALLLKGSLESSGWEVEEVVPFSPFLNRAGLWLAQRRREQVLVLLLPLDRVGYVSFCQVR